MQTVPVHQNHVERLFLADTQFLLSHKNGPDIRGYILILPLSEWKGDITEF